MKKKTQTLTEGGQCVFTTIQDELLALGFVYEPDRGARQKLLVVHIHV